MRRIAHHDHGQKPERMKFLRIIFACPKGAGNWRNFMAQCKAEERSVFFIRKND